MRGSVQPARRGRNRRLPAEADELPAPHPDLCSEPHRYRDLPVRLAEFGTVYRWEQTGELGGMTRVRGFTQDDAQCSARRSRWRRKCAAASELVKKVLGTLGMSDYRVRISLRDPASDKYVGDPANWDKAEDALREAVRTLGVPYTEERAKRRSTGRRSISS